MATAKKAIKPTPEQKAVVDCDNDFISLRGFHGTGKTGTLCAFIVERLARNRDTRVLGLSLTKLAAWNLRKNLITHPKWSPAFERRVTVGTFHSFGYRYVRSFAGLIGFTANFDIDNGINEELLKKLIVHKKYAGLKDHLKTLMKANRKHVRSGDSISEIARGFAGNDADAALIVETVRKLKQRKRSLDVMDFDDLLFLFYGLLRKDQTVLGAVLEDYNQLVVDEFQDVTRIQWRIVKLLMNEGMCFLGAGDPYQTIHRYAGASLKRFDQLEALKGCKAFELTQNHRSTKQIVALANGLLEQHAKELSNRVWSDKEGPKPEVYLAEFYDSLYQAIVKLIRQHLKQGVKLSQMAVVARFDRDLEKLMPTLDKNKVPYTFYSKRTRKEPVVLRAFKAILCIAFRGGGLKSWLSILPLLSGVGDKNSKVILQLLQKNNYSIGALNQYVASHRKGDLERLLKLLAEVQRHGDSPAAFARLTLPFLKSLRKKIGDIDLHATTLTEIAKESADIDELFLNIQDASFAAYYNFRRIDGSNNGIVLANIHQIKGREFQVVFVLGSPDYHFKNHGTFKSRLKTTDELFVMLTAITRARRQLYLLFPMAPEDWRKNTHTENASIFIRNCAGKLYQEYSVELKHKGLLQ